MTTTTKAAEGRRRPSRASAIDDGGFGDLLTTLLERASEARRHGVAARRVRRNASTQPCRSGRCTCAMPARDGRPAWTAPQSNPSRSKCPGPTAKTRGVLEAVFDPGCRLGEWDIQMLGMAAHLGALVLEIERGRLQLARADMAARRKARARRSRALIGSTPAMAALRSRIERVAVTDFTVLLEGESGVGKELVARQIHELSRSPERAFRGHQLRRARRDAARGRTLRHRRAHGDRGPGPAREVRACRRRHAVPRRSVGLSLSAQAKLLRAIQDLAVERVGGNGTHRVDIRIVAATNRGLPDWSTRRLFRPDLFYRLAASTFGCPRSGSADRTSASSPHTSLNVIVTRGGCGCRRARCRRCSSMAGRETSASWSA